MKIARWLILVGSILLFCASCMHLYGYTLTTQLFAGTNVQPVVIAAYRTLSLCFFVTLALLAPVFVMLSRLPGGKRVALVAMLIPMGFAALMFHYLGGFVGTIAVAVATAAIVIGVLLLPGDSAQD